MAAVAAVAAVAVAVVEVAAVVAVVAVVAGVEGAAVVAVVARNTIVSAMCFADLRYNITSFGMPILTEADDYLTARAHMRVM